MNLLFRFLISPIKLIINLLFILCLVIPLLIISISLELICEKEKADKLSSWIFDLMDLELKKINSWGCPKKDYDKEI